MGGLMYKDFVAIKGKRICIILLSAIALLCILRVIFPGSMAERLEMVFMNDQGIRINMLDLMFVTLYICIIFTIVCFIDMWCARLSEADESSSRIKNYVSSLPVSANSYVASKYVFVTIATYVLISLLSITGIVLAAFAEEGYVLDILRMFEVMVIPVTSLLILVASVELPLYILLGREKGNLAKVAIALLLVFVLIGFMLFADVSWLSERQEFLVKFINWYMKYQTEITLASYLSPVLDLFIFYLSYGITVFFKARQEA
ncbi:ABC-2 transporter permease [Butyrivibrio sp. AE2032]|uniref:ABC-2 transporter permease n=1 Tax=Butyrivibrio sp. AE2032 TaxID=1458463 RepID=UPI00054E635C|nr:ABC-2 transporter permease [Butyrivibrio sp. AE2032]